MKFFNSQPKPYKRVLRYLSALLLTPLLAACSPFPVLNGLGTDTTYRKLSTLPYGDAPRQQLDVYPPAIANKGIVVVFFYGGGWNGGALSCRSASRGRGTPGFRYRDIGFRVALSPSVRSPEADNLKK